MSFSPQSFFKYFSVLHLVKCQTNHEGLTKSTLFYLLGRKGEGREQFHHYLDQNCFHGMRKRDIGINSESAEELLEGREQIYESIITSTNVFDRLGDSDVREICRLDQKMRYLRQVGWRCQHKLLSRAGMTVE